MSVISRMIQAAATAGVLVLAGCAATPTSEDAQSQPRPLQPGDSVDILLWGEDDISDVYTIDEDGVLSIPLIGDMSVAGLTPPELEMVVLRALSEGYLSRPRVRIERVEVSASDEPSPSGEGVIEVVTAQELEDTRETAEAAEQALEEFRADIDADAIERTQIAASEIADLSRQVAQSRTALAAAEARLAAARERAGIDEDSDEEVDPEVRRNIVAQQNQVAMNRARLATLQATQAEAEEAVADGQNDLARLRQLEREADATREAYEALRDRAEEADARAREAEARAAAEAAENEEIIVSGQRREEDADEAREEALAELREALLAAERALEDHRSDVGVVANEDAPVDTDAAQDEEEAAADVAEETTADALARLQELEQDAEDARLEYDQALNRSLEGGGSDAPDSTVIGDGEDDATGDAAETVEERSRSIFGGLFGRSGGDDVLDDLADDLAEIEPSAPLAVASVDAAPFNLGGVEGVKVLPPMSLVEPETLLDDGSQAVQLLFGTNRERTREGDAARLTPERSQELLLGAVTVSVPTVPHTVGTIERPGEIPTPFGPVYTSAETPERHIMLRSGSFLSERQFRALARRIQRDAERFDNQALIFVHGFNNGFEDVAYRTAQIVHDLQFDGAAYFYSWPSRGELSRAAYRYDRESVLASRAPFREFLELVSESTRADKIHVVAHSMGTLLTMEVLRDINQERDRDRDPLFAEVVLAAPDIDRDVFAELAEEITGIAEGVTVYASAVDTALQISEQLAGRVPRAGGIGPDGPVVVSGVDTIDATAVSTDLFYALNHARFAEATAIIDDLDELLREGRRPPELRTPLIEPVTVSDTISYWRFRTLPQ